MARVIKTAFGSIWMSDNFWSPPYRSYPRPPNRLEQLAVRANLTDSELRLLLEREVERRRVERSEQA